MNPREQVQRLKILQHIAGARRDAELARLSGAAGRLRAAQDLRERLDAAVAREVDYASGTGEMPVFQALDIHLLLAERTKATLDERIANLAAEKEKARQTAALAFGRAEVLGRMQDRLTMATRPEG